MQILDLFLFFFGLLPLQIFARFIANRSTLSQLFETVLSPTYIHDKTAVPISLGSLAVKFSFVIGMNFELVYELKAMVFDEIVEIVEVHGHVAVLTGYFKIGSPLFDIFAVKRLYLTCFGSIL